VSRAPSCTGQETRSTDLRECVSHLRGAVDPRQACVVDTVLTVVWRDEDQIVRERRIVTTIVHLKAVGSVEDVALRAVEAAPVVVVHSLGGSVSGTDEVVADDDGHRFKGRLA
jgi:hypothetical protein